MEAPNLPIPAADNQRIREAAHEYFLKSKKLNYGKFYAEAHLTTKDRVELKIGHATAFEYWRQWLFVVSQRADLYCAPVREAAQELGVQLLAKVVNPTQVAKAIVLVFTFLNASMFTLSCEC